MKSISTINPAIMKNTECLIVKTCTPANNLKVGVLLDHIASLCSVSLPVLLTFEAIFQAKNNVRSTPASTALAQVSCRSHNMHNANCHLCSSGERNGAQRRTKVNSGKTMMQALGLLWLAKKHISGWSDIEQCKNQAHSLSGYWVALVWRR